MALESLNDFYSGKIFEIPILQRPYSWESTQIKSLLQDMKTSKIRDTSHYCGPIFIEDTDQRTRQVRGELNHYNILDGQQRTTTIMLVAKVLSNHPIFRETLEYGDEESQRGEVLRIQQDLMAIFSYPSYGQERGHSQYDSARLRFNQEAMDEMFNHIIFSNPADAPEAEHKGAERLLANFRWISENVDVNFEINDLDDLLEVTQVFLDSILVQMVDMGGNRLNKYTVFESINNRGLDLSEFDKIKNLCLHIAEQHESRYEEKEIEPVITKDFVQERWFRTFTFLYDYELVSDETDVIYDLWRVLENSPNPSTKDNIFNIISEEFQNLVDGDDREQLDRLRTFVSYWPSYCEAYCKVYTRRRGHQYSLENMTEIAATNLRRILEHISFPGILKCALTTSMLKYSQEEFESLTTYFEKYVFRLHGLNIVARTTTGRSERIALANHILNNQNLTDTKIEISNIIVNFAPLRSIVNSFFNEHDVYNKKWNKKEIYYFLFRIELDLNEIAPNYQNNLTRQEEEIEHILPQRCRTHWAEYEDWENEDTSNNWKHRIGNLTLTRDNDSNRDLWNYNIERKCNTGPDYTYEEGRMIEGVVAEVSKYYTGDYKWGQREINTLTAFYGKMLVKLWALPHENDLQAFQVQEDTFANFERYHEELDMNRKGFEENVMFRLSRFIDPIEICDFDSEDIV